MCQDCPTTRKRVRAAAGEVVANLTLAVVLYALPLGLLVLAGVGLG